MSMKKKILVSIFLTSLAGVAYAALNHVGMFNELVLKEQGNGNYVSISPEASLASNAEYTLGADGTNGQVLSTNGSGELGWVNALSDPMDTRGDLIYRNSSNVTDNLPVGAAGTVFSSNGTDPSWADWDTLTPMTTRGDLIRGGASGTAERFAAVTDNRVVRGDGTDVVSGQIDDPGFFTTGAAASTTNIGILTTGAQDLTGNKNLKDSIFTVDNTGSAATALSNGMVGIELTAGGMNTSNKYFPPVKWMSADTDLTTENPKFTAAITAYATETYGADTAGGAGLEFFTTPDSPGTTSVPLSAMKIQGTGGVIVGDLGSSSTSRLHTYVSSSWNTADFPFILQNAESANSFGNTVKIIGGGGASGVGNAASDILLLEDNAGTEKLRVDGSGGVFFKAHGTTASSANAFINSSTGEILRSTSSRRYKENITDIEVDTAKVYDLRTVSFNSKTEESNKRYFGLIAEEVAETLPELVEYNAEGQPESVQYALLSVLLLEEIKKMRTELDELKEVGQ